MSFISKLRLGKKPARDDPRTLRLGKYLLPNLPLSPTSLDLSGKVKAWGMMLNDEIGDCAIAGPGHAIMCWTSLARSSMFRPTDKAILKAYTALTGFNPKTGANDNGCVMLDVMNYWKRKGIASRRINAFAKLDLQNAAHVQQALLLFGPIIIGLDLPLTAQDQHIWDVVPGAPAGEQAPGSWGGHCVIVVAYDAQHITVVTWGQLLKMTWVFWHKYCDEAYCAISSDWITKTDKTPEGFDINTLLTDLSAI